MQDKWMGPRYFLLSFAAAFLSFSLIFLGFMTLWHPKETVTASQPVVEEEAYRPMAADSLTVLFMGTGPEGDAPGLFVLARFNPAGGNVTLAVLPAETAVYNNSAMEPLSEVYRYGGAAYSRDALAMTLGIEIDRYVRMDYNSFLAAAEAVGRVEYILSRELEMKQDGATITLSPGKQLLDGKKVGGLLRSGEGGKEASLERAGNFIAAIVNQRIDISLTVAVDSVFEKIINVIDTDISYTDYHDRKEAAAYLARTVADPARVIPLSGEWSGNDSLFTLTDTFLAQAAQMLG